jgi:hypothetical protein
LTAGSCKSAAPRPAVGFAMTRVFTASDRLTNRTALYNFQSVFVGTRVVQPRAATVEFRIYW